MEHFGSIYVVPRHGAYLTRCNSTVLSRLLCSPKGTRYWKKIDFVLRSPKYAAALIAGFWDADGGIYHEASGTPRIHLYNSNFFLLDRIADTLQTIYGIGYHLQTERKQGFPGFKDSRASGSF